MEYSKYLKDNTCFIVPSSIKKEILLYMSKNKILKDVCFFNINELKKKMFFDYNEKTVYRVCKEFNLSYDDSLLMINNLYYLNDNDLDDVKCIKLKEIKLFLDNNDLLIYSDNFREYINNKTVVTSYGSTSFFNEKIFSLLNNVTYMNDDLNELKKVYKFDFIEDEIEYIAYSISNLIEKGIDINNIKLVNVNKEYSVTLKKMFSFYNIPISFNDRVSMYDLTIVKYFINLLKDYKVEMCLDIFKEKYDINNTDNLNIYNKIVEVLNKCYFISDFKEDIEFVTRVFKDNYLVKEHLKNCVECISVEEMCSDDNYYFMIGFNNYFPKLYKDEDYLSDLSKTKLGFVNSSTVNKNIKNYYINKIKSIKNMVITYKEKDYFNSYLVSPLVNEVSKEVIINPNIDISVSYSSKFNELKMAKELDSYYKYSLRSDNLGVYLNNYSKDNYNSYNNSFKGIDRDKYLNMMDNKLTLSYSSLDNYYKCGFKYYLNNVLKENEETFSSFIGDLYHYVLSKMYDNDFNFEKEYEYYLRTRELSDKEEVLLIKLKEELKQNINLLKGQVNISDFKKSLCEKKISIQLKSKISISLIGFIDKIMFSEDKKYAYVVDYKTGKPEISFDNLENGLGMQLAIYMYLMHKSKDYADVFLVGCYLQRILSDDVNKEELKLDGYTFNDLSVIRSIDHNVYDKSFISGLKVKKSGDLSSTSKVFDSNYYNEVINIIECKIEEAIEGVTNAKFDINPKIVKGSNISCKFCKYNDICYHSYKDSVIISGGEEDE